MLELTYFLLGVIFSGMIYWYKVDRLSKWYQNELQFLIEKDNQLLSGWTKLTEDMEKALEEKGIK